MQTEYNRQQRRLRLQREIAHYQGQLEKFADLADPQRKRCFTVARRCLNRRVTDLAKLNF
jgi:hypothetical protein